MRKILFTYILIIICSQINAYEKRDLLQKELAGIELNSVLVKNQDWVKYPDYKDRQAWNDLFNEDKIYYIKNGEKYLEYEWKVVKATDYLEFTRSGNRAEMENRFNSNLNAISSLFIAELAEGKGRFTDQLINGVFHVCEMTTWSISAHLSLQRTKGSFPDHKDHVIELVSGDIGSMFSWIYYFLHNEFDKVSPLMSERLYTEIDRRILTPYLNDTRFWWMATDVNEVDGGFVNNWNPWCNSNVLQCFLLLEKDETRLVKGVYKSLVSVDKFINYTNDDGACEEGPSYWGHAAGKLYDYLQLLYDATDGKVSVFSEPIIKNMSEYIARSYVGNGWVVNFADASAKGDFNYWLIYRFGKMVQSAEMESFASYLKKNYPQKISVKRDMFRALADLSSDGEISISNTELIRNPFTWYPQTGFCYINDQNIFFAAKGGYNDESHNHNDIGTFSLYVDSDPFLIDVGVGTYTKKTFSSERYTIWTMQSNFHNLPEINGFQQQYGKSYKSNNAKADKNKKSFSLDIAKAYPSEAGIRSWTRSYKIKNNTLYIDDDFDISRPKENNILHFMTWGDVDISEKGKVVISVNGKKVEMIYDKNDFEPELEKIELDDHRLSNIWGNNIYRIILKASRLKEKGKYSVIIKC